MGTWARDPQVVAKLHKLAIPAARTFVSFNWTWEVLDNGNSIDF